MQCKYATIVCIFATFRTHERLTGIFDKEFAGAICPWYKCTTYDVLRLIVRHENYVESSEISATGTWQHLTLKLYYSWVYHFKAKQGQQIRFTMKMFNICILKIIYEYEIKGYLRSKSKCWKQKILFSCILDIVGVVEPVHIFHATNRCSQSVWFLGAFGQICTLSISIRYGPKPKQCTTSVVNLNVAL